MNPHSPRHGRILKVPPSGGWKAARTRTLESVRYVSQLQNCGMLRKFLNGNDALGSDLHADRLARPLATSATSTFPHAAGRTGRSGRTGSALCPSHQSSAFGSVSASLPLEGHRLSAARASLAVACLYRQSRLWFCHDRTAAGCLANSADLAPALRLGDTQ